MNLMKDQEIFSGHSFGHAIEGCTKYAIPHGIAVSYGMDIANAVSVHYGFYLNRFGQE